MKIAKKLSMKGLVGNVAAHIPMKEITEEKGGKTITKEVVANGQSVMLASIIGIARGLRTGESTYGPWTALTGEFVAVPLVGDKTGEQYRTGQLFLPDVALNLVTPFIEGAGNSGVEFAFNVGITADENSNTGYEYTAEFLTEPEKNDPLSALVAKALPAPAKGDAAKK